MRTLNVTLWILLATSLAGATEQKIKESEVPQAVLDGVAKKYPAAKRVGYEKEMEKGKLVYEVKVVNDGHKIDLDVAPDGQIVTEEEEIAVDATPAAVRSALAASAKYGKWTIKRAEKVTGAGGVPAKYELVLVNGKSKVEVVFSGEGKLLESESGND